MGKVFALNVGGTTFVGFTNQRELQNFLKRINQIPNINNNFFDIWDDGVKGEEVLKFIKEYFLEHFNYEPKKLIVWLEEDKDELSKSPHSEQVEVVFKQLLKEIFPSEVRFIQPLDD